MEALSFLKFWRPTNTAHKDNRILSGNSSGATEISNLVVESCDVLLKEEEEEGDDSFFELELSVSDFDKKKNTSTSTTHNNIGTTTTAAATRFDNSELQQQQQVHYNSSDVLSKRKIIPIEPTSKPQSPIALLKSAPKLRVSIFKKSKSMAATTLKTETQKHDNKLFTVKFKLEQEGPTTNNLSLFTRVCSLRKTKQQHSHSHSHSHGHRDDNESVQSYDSSSKRFSKDVIQKYFNLIKPLYVKVSKKNDNINNKVTIPRYSGELTEASPAASPAMAPMQSPNQGKNITAGFRVVSRHLRKSKSSSSAVLSPARRDDSLLLQHDGIQSAILHCKRSFNSSRDSSSLSRSTSCSSQETFSNLSCKDSSLFSRFSSDSLSEESISARKSNEEGNVSLEIKREKAVCP